MRLLLSSLFLFLAPMVVFTEEKSRALTFSANERYFGKIQYLRQEYGYIRAKSKIHGIRDITFSYSDTPREIIDGLSIGDQVSFTVAMYSSGKFSAKDVRKESFEQPAPTQIRSASPVLSISSNDNVADGELCNPMLSDFQESYCESSTGNDVFSSCTTNVSGPFMSMTPSAVLHGVKSFASEVDSFLEKVVMRTFVPPVSTCWLQF